MIDEKELIEIAQISDTSERNTALRNFKDKIADKISRELGKPVKSKEVRDEIRRRGIGNKIKEIFEGHSGRAAVGISQFSSIFDMRILNGSDLVTPANIESRRIIKNRLTIKNPQESQLQILEDLIKSIDALGLNEIGKFNLKLILDELKEVLRPAETREVGTVAVDTFLGSIEVSKSRARLDVYDYFEALKNEGFNNFIDDAEEFFDAISKLPEPEEDKEAHAKLLKGFADLKLELDDRLDYIGIYGKVEKEVIPANLRFFKYLSTIISANRLFDLSKDELDELETEVDESIDNDEASENWQAEVVTELLEENQAAENAWDRDRTINLDVKATSDYLDDIQQDINEYIQELDPLLAWEYEKDEKLLALTIAEEDDLIDMLENAREAIESQEIEWDIDIDADIESWIDELINTTVIEDREKFYLPISFIEENTMSQLYGEDNVEDVKLSNIQHINDFFEKLADLITEGGKDKISLVYFYQRVGQQSAGTDMTETFRGRPIPDDRAGEAQRRGGEFPDYAGRQSPPISQISFETVKSAFQKMLESAGKYYFQPAFSGRMVVEIPDFVSNIGGKIIEMQGAKLGFETVMGAAYNKLAETSVYDDEEGISGFSDNLAAISNFLESAFLKSIEIDGKFINRGLEAAEALTEIFGNKQANYDYAGALIAHLMDKTGDKTRIKNDFEGKSIEERYERFAEGYTSRKAYPIFAMPFWLNMNRGLLKEMSQQSKEQYERLVSIFQEVQNDLPILLRKMLSAHDAIREQLGKQVLYGVLPLNEVGFDTIIKKMQIEENLDLSSFEVESIIKELDSHENISKEYGISTEQVYLIKAHFR